MMSEISKSDQLGLLTVKEWQESKAKRKKALLEEYIAKLIATEDVTTEEAANVEEIQ